MYQGVGSLETGLLSTPPERLGFRAQADSTDGTSDFPEAKQEIEEGLQKLETLLNATVDKNFDKFEIYVLRNILSVPSDLADWVRLSHYEVCLGTALTRSMLIAQNVGLANAYNAPSVESMQMLRRKLAASRTLSRALLQEQNRNDAILQQLRSLTGKDGEQDLGFLTQIHAAKKLNVSPDSHALTTSTTFAMSQLPALKSLLADVRPRLASLRNASGIHESAKNEMKQERREYIEQRTKTLLERNGEAMADNAVALPAQALDPDEIQALEKVAQIFNPP